MITMTETPLETKTAIHAAVSSIAVHCDGANTEDGIGFNGSDTKFGKRCSWLSPEQWTDGIAWEAYNMLAKYKGQLEQYGTRMTFYQFPANPFWKTADTTLVN